MHFLQDGIQELRENREEKIVWICLRGTALSIQLSSNQMKGTMYLGQLLPNQEVGRFLKENKIYMTKLKLMDKMQVLKKQYEQEEKATSDSDIESSSSSFVTSKHITPNIVEKTNGHSVKKSEFNQNLDEIQGELKKLKLSTGK